MCLWNWIWRSRTRTDTPADRQNRVRQKLLNFDRKRSLEVQQKLVRALSDSQLMKLDFFGVSLPISLKTTERTELQIRRHDVGCIELNSGQSDVDASKSLDVKVVLYEMSRVHHKILGWLVNKCTGYYEYGPFHAALVIDDIILDWGPSHLIIPRRDAGKVSWVLEANISSFIATAHAYPASPSRADVSTAARRRVKSDHAEEEREEVGCVADKRERQMREKEGLLDEVLATVVRYNTQYTYGPLKCNCQQFVKECLASLGFRGKKITFARTNYCEKECIEDNSLIRWTWFRLKAAIIIIIILFYLIFVAF